MSSSPKDDAQTDNVHVVANLGINTQPIVNDGIQQIQQKIKRKHRRGKPKPKNWKFQMPKYNSGGGGGIGPNQRQRAKLIRSNSLAPYNTNRFLMEEHMVEVPLMTAAAGRTRDSSFSVDSEDNYFFSLPEDEEDFLTKEFSNVYERARVERLETLSKQELIQECLQMEDRFTSDQGTQTQINFQRIRALEQKVKELTRENYNLRCQVMRSAAASAASPPSAAAPTSAAAQPVIDGLERMVSSSEDTESDSSSTSSSSSSSTSSSSSNNHHDSNSNSSNNSAEFHDSAILNENDNQVAAAMVVDAVVLENQNNDLAPQDNTEQSTLNQAQNLKSNTSNDSNSVDELDKHETGG